MLPGGPRETEGKCCKLEAVLEALFHILEAELGDAQRHPSGFS